MVEEVDSYWYHRPESDHPPRSVQVPDQLDGEGPERLFIGFGKLDLTSKQRRALVREWCRALPNVAGVRLLWIGIQAPQALFDAACRVSGLEGLWIKHSRVQSLESLPASSSLRHFHLGSSTSLESIAPLRECCRLETLRLKNIKKIRKLDPISSLRELKEFGIDGSMWTTQRIDTLGPVGRLTELQYLSIVNLRASDRTLSPLFTLRKLRRFRCASWWNTEELAKLRELNPELVD